MHSAVLLRNHFHRFSDWVNKGRQDERMSLSEFLFRATSASLALGEMRFREQRCIEQFQRFKEHLTLKRKRIVFSSLDLFQLFHQFTPFMSAIRVLQNLLLRMVGRRLQLGTNIPGSLNDAIPKIGNYKLPERVVELVVTYWQSGGSQLKSYRDVDLHHFALSKHSFLEWDPEERIVIVLPDNPEVKTESKLSFAHNIDAIRYFGKVFDCYHQLVEDVCAELGFTPADMKEELMVEHFGLLEDGVKQTIALWMDDANASRALEVGQLEDRRLYFNNRDSRKLLS